LQTAFKHGIMTPTNTPTRRALYGGGRMENIMNPLKRALITLGVRGKVSVTRYGHVYVNGIYFGVYDFIRNTFVD